MNRSIAAGRPEYLRIEIHLLEMTVRPTSAGACPQDVRVMRLPTPQVSFYRALYAGVGERWFWIDRRRIDDVRLAKIIADPKVDILVLYVNDEAAGFAELDRRNDSVFELQYFGLMPAYIGRGLGRLFLAETIQRAWDHAPRQLIVQTCNLDHPKALSNYHRAGFRRYAIHEKQIRDPRLIGLLPANQPLPPEH